MTQALQALRVADFNWVRSLDSIWIDDGTSDNLGPNGDIIEQVVQEFLRETLGPASHGRGVPLTGHAGIGKTHFVGQLRRQVWENGGWFVLLEVMGLTDFWRNAALSYITSLLQPMADGRRQLEAVLAGVARRFKVEKEVETAFSIPNIEARKIVDVLVKGLMRHDMPNTLKHQDVFRAMCLLRSNDIDSAGLAHAWLQGYDADEQARAALGFLRPPPPPVDLVRGMSWIMSIAGPTMVAIDQIDGVVNPSIVSARVDDDTLNPGLGEALAAGLLELYDVGYRTMTVVTCLFNSWQALQRTGLTPFAQRYREPLNLREMKDPADIRSLIVSRLAPAYESLNFTPPYPSWPFTDKAIEAAAGVITTPRTILMRCDALRRRWIEAGTVTECDELGEVVARPEGASPRNGFAQDLQRHIAAAEVDDLIVADDDGKLAGLLREVFELYAREFEPDESSDLESRGDPAQKVPPLHGRLTFTYHAENDRERHFCFRALEHTHAISFQARLRAALTASGINAKIADRHLVLVRRSPIPGGAKTRQLFELFEKSGGVVIDPADADLRVFVALRQMSQQALADGRSAEFESWLRADKPLFATQFFKQAGLSPPPATPTVTGAQSSAATDKAAAPPAPPPEAAPPPATTVRDPAPAPPRPSAAAAPASTGSDSIPVGRRIAVGGEAVAVPLRLLPRHTAIIAGSGSGKTVLLRRIVEEAALAGIPAIVIDPNNDLSRLGDPWPSRPDSFTDEDDAKAQRYADKVEVVVWTPGVHGGNPLFLPVMPDFAGLGPDKDERQQATEMAAETLGPLAGAKNALQRGVLAEALRHFAAGGGGELQDFIALLSELPDGLSPIGNAAKLAAGMADQLHAAVATNPLLRADGPVLDPKLLFFGKDPARVRLSVINLSGLATDAAREDFVNRLQMALFSWIKRHPSKTGLLYVIDEAQTFLPSQKPALSLGSGIKLVAQARKYGLGMIVASQVPRGIHNQIVSNCTTQFNGKQSAPATIAAAQEIIEASGGRADDIGKLKAGEFYFATEGSGKPGKIKTPICLSYHPANPPTPDEVVRLARRVNATA
ncbi:helicase HerA domain-containing protein [Rhodopseudomonas palustris]|uniref:DUF87 domain-containing protein n=1 Tax=Rhodopseudomonas palustris TaxID=1076 RepID=A0A418VDR5_RHOPL|nr:DUF87 domain-containing protein [Rhodopseudomonas palustris]RJF74283.1 DUF87 domain-containing protein [Rhodopseudomonas palustris]